MAVIGYVKLANIVTEYKYLSVIMCTSNKDDEAIAGQIHSLHSLRMLAIAVMMPIIQNIEIAVVFIVVTCGATAPVNLRLYLIGFSEYFFYLNTELVCFTFLFSAMSIIQMLITFQCLVLSILFLGLIF